MTNPLFSREPGPRERHLQRRYQNPLFPADRRTVTDSDVMAARKQDQQEAAAFLERFRTVVQRAVELQPNVQSDVILNLKEDLDRCYEECAALPGDQSKIKAAIKNLVATIMRAVREGAKNDPVALKKLEEEDIARELHYQLLEQPLVADLLRPQSLIPETELLPTLLSVPPDTMRQLTTLFTGDQLTALVKDGRTLVQSISTDTAVMEQARGNLVILEAAAADQASMDIIN